MRQKLLSSFRLRVVMLVAILCASVCCAWGETYTMSLDSGTKNGTKNVHWTSNNATLTYSAVSWSASFSGGSITNSNTYVQIGSKSSPFTTISLSTSGISGTITEVKVGCGAYQSNATVAVTVGGNTFGGNAQTVGVAPTTSTACSQNTFSGSASGEIVITITNGSEGRAGYIDYVSVTYTTGSVTPTCATPTFSPAAGTYTSAQNVTISTTTDAATIYYTTDGNDPTTNSSVYSSAISVSETTTIKAMAVKSEMTNSSVASATYTIVNLDHAGTQAEPYSVADARNAIDANVGLTNVYATGIVSEIVTAFDDYYGNISYNISADGLTTSNQLQAYRGKGKNGNAFTSADDIKVGDVVVVYGTLKKYNSTYEFDQNNQLANIVRKPSFSPAAGTVNSGETVTLSSVLGATIYYTTDGTEPTTNSATYSSPITITEPTTIKAFAVNDGLTSEIVEAAYTVSTPTATPTISLATGTYTTAQSVTITCETTGATIYYTTDGNDPTTSSTEYTTAITIDASCTLKAIAVASGLAPSAVASATYTMQIPTLAVSPTTATNFTYNEGEGPSATQTFTLSGENLTAAITVSVPADGSFEISSDGTTFSNSISRGNGDTFVVRMKAGLSTGNYNGTVTISSTGADDVTIDITGTVAGANVTWDLTTNSYSSSAENLVSWTSSQVTMTLAKGSSSTAANNYLGGSNNYTQTRFYQNQVLTIAPASGYQIVSAEITAVSSYVAGFTGNSWTNATASTSGTTVTVTPTDGTQAMSVTISGACRATAVTVYYTTNSTPSLSVDPTTATSFTYEVGDGPSDDQMFDVTGINLTDDITVSVTGEYELSDGNPYTSSLTLSSGDAFMVHLKEDLEIGSYDGEITISSTGATSLTIALSGTVTAAIPAAISPANTAVNVGSAAGEGTIDLTYTKVDESTAEVRFFDANGNSVDDTDYSWIAADIDSNNDIYYLVNANTGAARTAYIKVYGQDNNGGDVFSELITITQSKYQPTGTLSNANIVAAGEGATGYSDWTVTDGKGKKWFTHAIKNQHSNATSNYHYLQIKKSTTNEPCYILVPDYGRKITSLKMTVSGASQAMTGGGNTATIYFSASNTTSDTGTDVASGSGASSVTIDCSSLDLNTGYITASGAVRIWDVEVTYEPLKLNSYGYATYASTNALEFTNADGFTAWQITGVSGNAITFSQITGAVDVGTGVLLMGTGGAEVTIINAASGETLSGNKLEGVTVSKSVNSDEFYGLSGENFVKINAGTVPAGRAILPASEVGSAARLTFVFEDDTTTGISTMHNSEFKMHNEVYNLNGQRVNDMKKGGLYIMNGKKVIMK